MTAKTTTLPSNSYPIISSNNNGIKTIKTIFEWSAHWPSHPDENRRHSRSHCLLRIYLNERTNQAVLIASELYSNSSHLGISVDFQGLAQAAMKELVEDLAIPESQITGIAHYGRFSEARSYENLHTPDSFYQINRWEVKEGVQNDEEETYLLKEQVSELMGGQQLEPVEQVLKELDAADLSDWSQVDVEKALAESRQRWERANSSNAAN